MSLKAELEIWVSALVAFDDENFEKALLLFSVRMTAEILTTRY